MIPFRISQGQLNLLQVCPRKFQQTYLDQLATPLPPEQQERITWGSRFHLLMQQRELGLPIDLILAENPELEQVYHRFVATAVEIFNPNPAQQILRESEHQITLNFQGFLLTVVYDLLILEQHQARIFDWKTYPRPQNRQGLAQNWQTLLYPFVLAETSHYQPEQISMTYWFVQGQPQSLTFTYNQAQHLQIKADLSQLLDQLSIWLTAYQEFGIEFPQVPNYSQVCEKCHFTLRCQREKSHQPLELDSNYQLDLSEIEEVSLN